MDFYQEIFGGILEVSTLAETVKRDGREYVLPLKMQEVVVSANLTNENWVLFGTDLTEVQGRVEGNAISLLLQFDEKKRMEEVYFKLAFRSQKSTEIQQNKHREWIGMVTDQFGNSWILNCGNTLKEDEIFHEFHRLP